MDKNLCIPEALIELADLANCVAGDFHTMHLNFKGHEFDNFHKEVLKTYYEEAADDYDGLSELARMYGNEVPNTNESGQRISYQSYTGVVDASSSIMRTMVILDELLDKYAIIFNAVNSVTDCVKAICVANFIQTRIEYWCKERHYFVEGRRM